MKKSLTILIIGLLIIGGYYWTRNKPRAESGEAIKIGVVLPMTGIAANYGEHQLNAIKLAVEEINNDGGVLGKNIEIIAEDDSTDPKKTVAAFQKVIDVDKVPVVIGGAWDFLANAAMPVVDARKIPTISASAPPDTLTKPSDYFFTTMPPIDIHEPVVEKYLRNEKGGRIAIMYANNAWGVAHLNIYKKAAEATSKEIIAEIVLPKFDNNDIQAELTKLKVLKPDIILTAINFGSDPKLTIERNKELGLNAKIFSHDNLIPAYFNQGIKKEYLKGAVVYRLAVPDSKFIKSFKEKYGKDPISEADKAYDAVYVIKKAIEISKDPSSAGIVAGIKRVNFNGASGSLDYTSSNWPMKDTSRLEIFDGENFVPYLEN